MHTAFSVKDADGRPTNEAVISHADNLKVGIVCAYQDGTWEPLWMIKEGDDGLFHKHELPSCFHLNQESIDVLDSLREIETEIENMGFRLDD